MSDSWSIEDYMERLFVKTQKTWEYLTDSINKDSLKMEHMKWFENLNVAEEMKKMGISDLNISKLQQKLSDASNLAKVLYLRFYFLLCVGMTY